MLEAKVVNTEEELFVELPMVQPTGKIRVKARNYFSEYGIPVATRQTPVNQKCYVEWQIGYDLEKNADNLSKTSIPQFTYINYKEKSKIVYELCEIIYYAVQKSLVSIKEVKDCYEKIKAIEDKDTFEELETMNISRTNARETIINGLQYYKMTISYPLLVHKFGNYDILAEIAIKEKQRAVGTQAMLYLCLPITSLIFQTPPIGRTLNAKETACWIIHKEEAKLALEVFRIFGMLSPKHHHDVLSIFRTLFEFCA